MRFIILFVGLFFLFSCKIEQSKTKKPSFLIGNWVRTNNKPNTITYENWNSDFTGLGFTLKEKDTTFKEILSIIAINDTLHLKVVGVNEKPTLFNFTKQTDSSFVAENPKHDFPTKIKYCLTNDTLKAKVSNKDFAIDFSFVKH